MPPANPNDLPDGECCAVPQLKAERERIRHCVNTYAAEHSLTPPLSLNVLKDHAHRICTDFELDPEYINFVTVLLGNAVWLDTVSTIPFKRRLLLIPQCIRKRGLCPASMDGFGLLCEHCGGCPTGDIVEEAEALGYVVLVAEGTTIVTQLLESGQVEAVIGVGCLESLERTFPYAIAAAVPALAVPLYQAGCDNTRVDIDWIRHYTRLLKSGSGRAVFRPDLNRTKNLVHSWFTAESMSQYMSVHGSETESIGIRSMLAGGKRWRPILTVSVFRALTFPNEKIPPVLIHSALAVECFHKASLIHDDIEDDDEFRYGMPTLHAEEGLAIALNTGDYLLGEGYRLLGDAEAGPVMKSRLLTTAARGHRELTMGQGAELIQQKKGIPVSIKATLDIFRSKTAPAFEVALNLGAICAGANQRITETLAGLSSALGVAYQIRDDIEDIQQDSENCRELGLKPSLIVAMAWDQWCQDRQSSEPFSTIKDHQNSDGLIPDSFERDTFFSQLPEMIRRNRLVDEAWLLFDSFKEEALDLLSGIDNQNLKTLLFQLIFKILGGVGQAQVRNQPVHGLHQERLVQAK